jgi:hypothetical protein
VLSVGEVGAPLADNEEVHESEEDEEEDYLGDELKDDVELVLEVERVGELHAYSQGHLHDSQDHRQLHLERIQIGERVNGHVPSRINTYWVSTVFMLNYFSLQMMSMFSLNWIATVKEKERNRHEVIVDESTESSKDTHKQNQVSHREHFSHARVF